MRKIREVKETAEGAGRGEKHKGKGKVEYEG